VFSTAARRRSEIASTSSSITGGVSSTANSSPPQRATVSNGRTPARSAAATCTKTWFPASYPKDVLNDLKSSMSAISSASELCSRWARAISLRIWRS
jgi:hypothetical protein